MFDYCSMILDASASSSSVFHSSSIIGLFIDILFEMGILMCLIGVFLVSRDEGV